MSRKVKYMPHLAKRKGRNIAIVPAVVGVKQRRVSGDARVGASALGDFSGDTLEFDSVDRRAVCMFMVSAEKRRHAPPIRRNG
jgi:hypothetical protein